MSEYRVEGYFIVQADSAEEAQLTVDDGISAELAGSYYGMSVEQVS